MRRPLLGPLCALALAAGLAACGGGGSSTAPGVAATSGPSSPKSPVAAGKAHQRGSQATRAERRKAGGAAPFVAPGQDNSVPTFGSEAGGAERRAAEANLRAYLAARAAGKWATACSLLSTSLIDELKGLGGDRPCPAAYKTLSAGESDSSLHTDPLGGPLLALRVKGGAAFALWLGPRGQRYVMPMTREGGEWKVTQIAPIPYPLGSDSQQP